MFAIILQSGGVHRSGKSFNFGCYPAVYCQCRPANKEELFNLRHASARNVIERIFGVLKRRFRILVIPPEYDLQIQTHIPPALCALHNFIRRHDPSDINDFPDATDNPADRADGSGIGELATSAVSARERASAGNKRDQIAQDMWNSYQQILRERGEGWEDVPRI